MTKHSVGEYVRIMRLVVVAGDRGCRRRCFGIEALREKEGEGTRC